MKNTILRSREGERSWWLGLVVALVLSPMASRAQAVRLQQRSAGTALLSSSITVSASPSAVNFSLVQKGLANGSQPVSINSSWTLGVAATVRLYAYFSSTAALTNTSGASYAISNAQVSGLCSTGQVSSYTTFTQGGPFGGATSLVLFQQAALVSLLVSRTDQLNLRIDLSSSPQLPAGQYTGTLILQAQAL